jgi:hypothetical protein
MKIAVRLSDKVGKQDNLLLEVMRKLAEES